LATPMVKLAVLVFPAASSAWTVTGWLVAVSKSNRLPSSTLTTPLPASIWNRPPASSVRL